MSIEDYQLWDDEDGWDDPDGNDDQTSSTGRGAQSERMNDGVVAFQWDGGQRQYWYGHRHTLKHSPQTNSDILTDALYYH